MGLQTRCIDTWPGSLKESNVMFNSSANKSDSVPSPELRVGDETGCSAGGNDADSVSRLPCKAPCRVVLASSNTLAAMGLRQILSELGAAHLCAVAADRDQLIQAWRRLGRIDVLIAEPDLLQDVDALPELARTRLLLLSHRAHSGPRPPEVRPCGFLSERSDLQQVHRALSKVIACEGLFQPRACADCPLIPSLRTNQPLPLSERESEVFALIGQGYGTNAIAQTLGRSIKTIESHRHHIKLKLKLEDARQLIDAAHRWVRGERI